MQSGTPTTQSRHQARRTLTDATKRYVATMQQWMCKGFPVEQGGCGRIRLPDTYQVDHIQPWSLTHDDDTSNLVALCPNCHARCTKREQRWILLARKYQKSNTTERLCIECKQIYDARFGHHPCCIGWVDASDDMYDTHVHIAEQCMRTQTPFDQPDASKLWRDGVQRNLGRYPWMTLHDTDGALVGSGIIVESPFYISPCILTTRRVLALATSFRLVGETEAHPLNHTILLSNHGDSGHELELVFVPLQEGVVGEVAPLAILDPTPTSTLSKYYILTPGYPPRDFSTPGMFSSPSGAIIVQYVGRQMYVSAILNPHSSVLHRPVTLFTHHIVSTWHSLEEYQASNNKKQRQNRNAMLALESFRHTS